MTRQTCPLENPLAIGRADLLLLSLLFAVGVVLGWQGWRSTVITPDYVPYLDNARALIRDGRLPVAGHLGSMTAFFPPGASYLFVPGLVLFRDIRLAETPVALLSHAGSLVFLFLIARHAFGVPTDTFTVVRIGVSDIGIMMCDGFIVGHFYNPVLYLAAVWLQMQWVSRRRASYLALVLAVVSLAVYVQHPVLLLAAGCVPVLWVLYRPPVSIGAVAIVGLTSALL